jgi:hypothetical protein
VARHEGNRGEAAQRCSNGGDGAPVLVGGFGGVLHLRGRTREMSRLRIRIERERGRWCELSLWSRGGGGTPFNSGDGDDTPVE